MLGELTRRIHNIIVSNVVSGEIQVKRTRVLLGEFRDDFFQHAHVVKLRFLALCVTVCPDREKTKNANFAVSLRNVLYLTVLILLYFKVSNLEKMLLKYYLLDSYSLFLINYKN